MSDLRPNNSHIHTNPEFPFDLPSTRLSPNGFSLHFEAAILAQSNELYADVANGSVKLYHNAEELFAALDAENIVDVL